MKIRKQLTLGKLSPIVDDYLAYFDGWQKRGRETIYRRSGCVVQEIGFERLRTGEYRPTSGVRILTSPNHAGLHQFLNMSVRAIDPDHHAEYRGRVIAAMCQEIRPSVLAPLTNQIVVQTYEQETVVTQPDRVALATLNAYLGDNEKALYWCSQFEAALAEINRPLVVWEMEKQREVQLLKIWIQASTAADELSKVLDREVARLGV